MWRATSRSVSCAPRLRSSKARFYRRLCSPDADEAMQHMRLPGDGIGRRGRSNGQDKTHVSGTRWRRCKYTLSNQSVTPRSLRYAPCSCRQPMGMIQEVCFPKNKAFQFGADRSRRHPVRAREPAVLFAEADGARPVSVAVIRDPSGMGGYQRAVLCVLCQRQLPGCPVRRRRREFAGGFDNDSPSTNALA